MTKRTLFQTLTVCAALLGGARLASADDGPAAARDAGKHFQRAVSLYGEADYRAALVEFKRAYAASPHPSVLYNVGETQYQLQDYAGALTTFERYLAESAATDPHRAEVEGNVEVLRARVGHLTIVTIPAGADVTVDEQAVGRTPLDRAVLVSIGHRKVTGSVPGRPSVTRYVDVATDDNLAVTLQLPDGPAAASTTPATAPPMRPVSPVPTPSSDGPSWRVVGWTTTGLLTAGAITFGALASKASNDLAAARGTYPISASTLSHDASLTSTYASVADALAVAAVAIGGITLVSTIVAWSSSDEGGARRGAAVTLGPASARLDVSF